MSAAVPVDSIEPGDIVRASYVPNQIVTHVTRDGKGRYVIRTEFEIHYDPDTLIELVRKVGT